MADGACAQLETPNPKLETSFAQIPCFIPEGLWHGCQIGWDVMPAHRRRSPRAILHRRGGSLGVGLSRESVSVLYAAELAGPYFQSVHLPE